MFIAKKSMHANKIIFHILYILKPWVYCLIYERKNDKHVPIIFLLHSYQFF